MNRIIVADSQFIFRTGLQRLLAEDEALQITAQCGDLHSLYRSIEAYPDSLVVIAASLLPEWTRIRMLLDAVSSRGIVVAEANASAWSYLEQGFWGVVFRDAGSVDLLECVRRVAAGDSYLPVQSIVVDSDRMDMGGRLALDELSNRELRMIPFIIVGCSDCEIAAKVRTTEQAVRKTVQSIYKVTGTCNRQQLALFAMQHPVLTNTIAELDEYAHTEEPMYSTGWSAEASFMPDWSGYEPFHRSLSSPCLSVHE